MELQRFETSIAEVFLLQPKVFRDGRGLFFESYHQSKFNAVGVRDQFVQDNHSRSTQRVLRGLHYQLRRPQAKLCRVIEGEALDVVLDIRTGSPFFGKWVSAVLSAEAQNQIYVPQGFAHGFVTLTETVQFLYKCSDFYDPSDERGIAWDDPDLKIDWRISDPILSEKDKKYLPLTKTPKEFLPAFEQTPR